MSSTSKHQLVVLAVSTVLAVALFWLASEFREGFLGSVQEALALLFAPAYIIGVLFGGNAHSPSAIGFFLGLLVESYFIVLVFSFLGRRLGRSKVEA